VASLRDFSVSLTIERAKDQNAIYVRQYIPEGDQRYKPQTVLLITLKGGPDLFPSFDIPSVFPPLSRYTEASVTNGLNPGNPEKIDGIGSCVAPQ
jgi:hypothetical protein